MKSEEKKVMLEGQNHKKKPRRPSTIGAAVGSEDATIVHFRKLIWMF